MHLIGLTTLLRQSKFYRDHLADLQNATSHEWHVIRAARPYVLASLAQDWHAPIIYLTARGKRAYNVAEQLPVWLGDTDRIYRYADPTPALYDRLPWDKTVIRERLEALKALLYTEPNAQQPIIVSSARALMQRTMPVHQFRKHTMTLEVGKHYIFDDLIKHWVKLGYEPVTMVTEPGTFSRRGGILDIFPMAEALPIRLDFFDNELDELRVFDPSTQRTVEMVKQLTLVPAREVLPDAMSQVARHLESWFESVSEGDISSIAQDADAMSNAQLFPYIEHYLPYVYENPVSLLDYASDDTLVIVEDITELQDMVQSLAEEADTNHKNNIKTQQLADDHPIPYVDWATLSEDLARNTTLHISSYIESTPVFKVGERFGGQLRPALTHVRECRSAAERIVVVSQQINRLIDIWYEQDSEEFIPKVYEVNELPDIGDMFFTEGELSEGWSLTLGDDTLHLITDAELFGWSRPEPRRRKSGKRGATRLPESDYSDWNDGDYVVHVDYGIGQFQGMRSRTIEGNDREYLLVEYAENGLLFVPIHQADRLTRYVGADEAPPRLNTMGKAETWIKTREKARKNAYEEAQELLKIYAQRVNTSGFAYTPDGAWQHELEASFPYVETEDQLRVIHEIKADMETHMPMDRLVCGDVGYGKTEVALRAAFKAVTDGKQVAVLVPTTVLADQHYKTFSRRIEPFPIKVDMLSRYRTKAEQSKILTQLANGNVDIIIGTHRLLSKDITIPNLGLIIIDEEQRFGVKHKEHFKKFRANVDVLTLTATPIPRTLYMGLSGVRDISMLQTPPEDRLPVITHVGSFDPKLTRQAILRELDRGGQIFVIHNRVKSLDNLRDKLERIVPEASIITAHGQMSGRQLENVIAEFSKGTYDILLATSIIENGIDMPNVNTLLVDRADWFGMSQLYQIRGRVGRGATQAYAYFFHQGGKKLTDEARARLETLAENTELGSGFQISVRDLELRGSGDILSMRQTGHVATVGLQLYTQLLQQAVNNLKGDPDSTALPEFDQQERIVIDIPVPAYIPNDWIPDMALRLQLYRRIGSLQTLEEIDSMQAELRDRFGKLPNAVQGLLYQIRVKLMAVSINAKSIIKPREHIKIKIGWLASIDRDALQQQLGEDIEVTRTDVQFRVRDDMGDLWKDRLVDILAELKEGLPEQVGV